MIYHMIYHISDTSKSPIGNIGDVMSRTYEDVKYCDHNRNLPLLAGVLRAPHGGARWPVILLQGTPDRVVH
jgi:hypothetical protein